MFCDKCGKDLGNTSKQKFCPDCGAALLEEQKVKPALMPRGKNYFSYRNKIGAVIVAVGIGFGLYLIQNANCKVYVENGTAYLKEGIFEKKTELEEVTIPNDAQGIGRGVFNGCVSLRSVTFPEGIITIGDNSFSGCISLGKINFPGRVKSIGNSAFDGCRNLSNITFSEGIESIGNNAFSECFSLGSISFPGSVTSIGDSAFAGCENLNDIIFSDGLKNIGNEAFSNCNSLKSVELPLSVTSIGDSAFYGCSLLQKITLPRKLEFLGSSSFKNTGLIEVEMPIAIERRGEHIFSETPFWNNVGKMKFKPIDEFDSADYRLMREFTKEARGPIMTSMGTIVKLSELELKNIETEAVSEGTRGIKSSFDYFGVDKGIYYGIQDSSISVLYNTKKQEEVVIPSIIYTENDFYYVDSIYKNAFMDNIDMKKIILPDGLSRIGEAAFFDCENLSNITLPANLSSIGKQAFSGCESLNNIVFPEGLLNIEHSAFSHCSNLDNITLPESLISIEQFAFLDVKV